MGIFDSFRRNPPSPTDLRTALIEATAREDWDTLAALCQKHQDEIRREFPQWQKVPDAVRHDPEARGKYAQTLITVARLFEQAGDGSLLASLMGNAADNPIMRWQRALAAAQSLLDEGQPEEAVDLLQSAVRQAEGLTGDAVAHLLPRTLGMLGVALFQAGNRADAIATTQQAKTLCEEAGDAEGVAIYDGNLRRMQGGSEVVFHNEAGQAVSIADLHRTAGRIRYEIRGNEPIPRAAEELHQKARQCGGEGEFEQAIALLEQAIEKAPHWPYPMYDLAYTYLLMKNTDRALEYYRKTVELAPRGFFTAITALHTLERERRGELPSGLYLAYVSLEHIDDTAKKAHVIRQLAEQVPAFAPAWKDLAVSTDDNDERNEAIRKGLAANPDAETRGMLQLNEALDLHARGERDAAIRLLEELIRDEASTHATEHLAKAALTLLTQ
jgi:tetratricopeptide (TPR) repeat protein